MANLPFPWRGEELPSNAFWFRSGSDGWDFNAQRRTDNGWDRKKANPGDPVKNEDEVGYNRPVYAVADGEVISSWRNAPENPGPGESHPGRLATPKTIPRSGNHVSVLGSDGSVILYAHMTTSSVPTELCPFRPTACWRPSSKKRPHPVRVRPFVLRAWRCPTLTWGDPTLPSALSVFTSEFEMGSGGSRSLLPPGNRLGSEGESRLERGLVQRNPE